MSSAADDAALCKRIELLRLDLSCLQRVRATLSEAKRTPTYELLVRCVHILADWGVERALHELDEREA